MQGDPDDNKAIFTQLKEIIMSAHQPQDFLDCNIITVPKREDVKDRLKTNFERYQGNYLIIVLIFCFMFVCIRPSTILLVAVWGAYFVFAKKGEQSYNMKGLVIKKDWIFKGLIVFSVLYTIFLYTILYSLLASCSLVGMLILIHMLFFYDTEDDGGSGV